jgi:hypothetical protein
VIDICELYNAGTSQGRRGRGSLRCFWKFWLALSLILENYRTQFSPILEKHIRQLSSIFEIFCMKAAHLSQEKTEKLFPHEDTSLGSIRKGFMDINEKCVSCVFKNSGYSDDLCNITFCNHIFPMLFYVQN